MKRVLFCLIAVMFVAQGALAAEIDTGAGAKALIFQFSGLSDLGLSGWQGGVGARYYLSDDLAIRPGVDFSLGSSKVKGTSGSTDDKESDVTLGANVAIEMHRAGPKSISPYLGAGAGFSTSKHTEEPSHASSPSSGTLLKSTTVGTAFAAFVMAGFEWGFSESLTLGGEYRAGLNFGSGHVETERQGVPTVKTNEASALGLGFGTASLFLSVGI